MSDQRLKTGFTSNGGILNKRQVLRSSAFLAAGLLGNRGFASNSQFSVRDDNRVLYLQFQYVGTSGNQKKLSLDVAKEELSKSVFYDVYSNEFQSQQKGILIAAWEQHGGKTSSFGQLVQRLESEFPGLRIVYSQVGLSYRIQYPSYFNRSNRDHVISVDRINSELRDASKKAAIAVQKEVETIFDLFGYRIRSRRSNGFDLSVNYKYFIDKEYGSFSKLAQQIQNQSPTDPRSIINELLVFMQSIPYSDLLDRSTSQGKGFSPPLRLFAENMGDCDSKSCAALAILRNIFPKLPIAMIETWRHALIGVAVAPTSKDITINHNGRTYVLAETVGPARAPLGEIAEFSLNDLRRNDGNHVWEI